MNEEVINKLQEIFTPVAEKIGQGAQFGWEVVLRQQIALGVGNLVVAGLMLVIIILSFSVAYKFRKYIIEETEGAGFLPLILTIIPILVFCGLLYSGILKLINPAYYALEFFINLAK